MYSRNLKNLADYQEVDQEDLKRGYGRDLRSFEIWFEFELGVPIWFDLTVMGQFASSMSDHTPVLFNVFEPLRIGMRNL